MSFGHPVQLRLPLDKQFFYQEEAARVGKSLSAYLRERLEADDEMQKAMSYLRCEIASLRVMLEDLDAQKTNRSDTATHKDPTLFEMLLLIRQLCRPEHIKIAQGELSRLGLIS